jgi:hypothetical protein
MRLHVFSDDENERTQFVKVKKTPDAGTGKDKG